MKNRLLLILILFGGLALFNSCNENKLLDKFPKDAPNADNFFIGVNSARQAAMSPHAVMTLIPHDFRRYWVTYQDIFSDDSYTRVSSADRLPALRWSADPTWYHWYSWYFCFYKGINNANFAIDGIPTSTDPTFTEDKQAPYIAVAKLWKGFCYLMLTHFYGDAHYWPHFLQNPDSAFIPRQPKAEVVANFIEDLKYAKANLPHVWTGDDVGFPTKAAAAALLGKTYLFNRDFSNAVTSLSDALSIADQEGYSLMPDYLYMMSWDSQQNGDNTEFIFTFPFILNGTSTGNQNEMMVERRVRDCPGPVWNIYGGGWGYALPSRNLYEEFEAGDPRRVASMWIPGDYYGTYNQSDPFTIPSNSSVTPTPPIIYQDSTYHQGDKVYYRAGWSPYSNTNTRKIWEPDYKDGVPLEIDEQQDGYDIPLIRYADLVLMYAEALIENNQVDLGIDQINRVRKRPSVNMPDVPHGLSQNDARKALRHERRIELNMEGLRLADMMRWTRDDGLNGTIPGTTPGSYLEQKFGSGLNGVPVLMKLLDNSAVKEQSLSFPKNLLFSIPQEELDRNKNMTNNPGW